VANISKIESKFINELIKDCITHNLDTKESLAYIESRFKKISESTYQLRKSRVMSDGSINMALNNYTRVGYVRDHMEALEHVKMINADSRRQLFFEMIKSPRDEKLILEIKQDIRDNIHLLSELSLGTPIIASIKAKIQQLENQNDTNTKTIQISK
jgi:hypothetical protein